MAPTRPCVIPTTSVAIHQHGRRAGETDAVTEAARSLVEDHERTIGADDRRRLGAHYTPEHLARRLVEAGIAELGHVPELVCDPACGAGSFLLAAADALTARGADPADVVNRRLIGGEIDPAAAAVARRALIAWARSHEVSAAIEPVVVECDTLVTPAQRWLGERAGRIDLVVGNPPFLGQLSSDTARDRDEREAATRRFGAIGAYTDSSALFLLVAVELLAPGGVTVMLQPQSLLAARDARPVRSRLLTTADLVGFWATDDRPFDAGVHVCAPMFRRCPNAPDDVAPEVGPEVVLRWGPDVEVAGTCPVPGDGPWGPLLAGLSGVPPVADRGGPRLSSLATATAGFRDEFYALAEAARDPGEHGWSDAAPRLVTVGMIGPGRTSWGSTPRLLAGRRMASPRLDMGALAAAAPRVADWVSKRSVPKVLVATQTRVIEAAADPAGTDIPVTPTISVEPFDGDDVWRVTAALLAPPVAARAVATHFGAGLSSSTRCVGRRVPVLDVELPSDDRCWDLGAACCRELARTRLRTPDLGCSVGWGA